MSWHYLAVQAGESSEAICAGGEPWQPSRLKSIHGRFYCNGKLTESYLDSLSGTTCEHSTGSRGVEKSTSLPEGSPVRISPLPEKAQGSPENGLGYGLSFPASSARFDRNSSSWKILHSLFPEDSIPCSVTLPRWGIMRNGELSERTMPAHLTNETESGYWPTPAARDYKGANSREHCEVIGKGRKHMDQLPNAVAYGGTSTRRTWLTPKTPTGGGQMERKTSGGGLRKLEDQISREHGQNTGQLNPDWVEWLMGWPIKWTSLEPMRIELFQEWRCKNGQTTKDCNGEALRNVWKRNDTAKMEERKIRQHVQEQEILQYRMLRKGEQNRESIYRNNQKERPATGECREVRGVRINEECSTSSCRWETDNDSVSEMPRCRTHEGWFLGKVPRVAQGINHRVNRLKAIGNGQVPAVAALAWEILTEGII